MKQSLQTTPASLQLATLCSLQGKAAASLWGMPGQMQFSWSLLDSALGQFVSIC